jgi:ATP-dependent DNA helicase RecQ
VHGSRWETAGSPLSSARASRCERAPDRVGTSGAAGRIGASIAADALASGDELALFERLRALRKRIADEQGVPAYIVFNDAVLRAMAAHRPASAEALLRVPGVGPAKLERYGEAFLEAIANSAT